MKNTTYIKKGWKAFWDRPLFFTGIFLLSFLVGLPLQILSSQDYETIPSFILLMAFILVAVLYTLVQIGILRALVKTSSGTKAGMADFHMNWSIFWKLVGLQIIMFLAVVLGLVLLIIPGIIIAISFSFVLFVLVDHPKASIDTILKASTRITKGNRWKLLGLIILMSGINILGALAFGIGSLITIPFTSLTWAYAYHNLKSKTDFKDLALQ